MPVHNEARTVNEIVNRVLDAPVEMEIELVCVDDGSTDRSWTILQELTQAHPKRIRLLRHDTNRGKGAALQSAIGVMTGDVAIVQDADLEYDPADYPRMLKPILDGRADAVYGSRFAASQERKVLMYWHSLGNKVLATLANSLNDINLTDVTTGFKAVRADLLRDLRLTCAGFGIEAELTTRLAQWGASLYEVPVSYHGRSFEEGKQANWKDGVEAIGRLFWYRFVDRRFTRRGGHDTLESLGSAGALNRWILSHFEPHLGNRVLEAGCGTGNMTKLLLKRERLVAVDIDSHYCEKLRRRYGHLSNLQVEQVDLEDAAAVRALGFEAFDTVVSINVLEHVADDVKAASLLADALEPGGNLLVLVPAQPDLYSAADVAMGHHRRYEPTGLRTLLEGAGLEVTSIREFNRLGVVGWRFNKITGRSDIAPWQARLYGAIVPLARRLDDLGVGRGLSLVAIATRPHSSIGSTSRAGE